MSDSVKLPDGKARDRIVRERKRNVVVEAGAGTGKTQILVDRILHLVAPTDGSEKIPLERIAAITFTRRAAGELKLRLRREMIAACSGNTKHPTGLLCDALDTLDVAYIGTIHSFCDRLLRLRPMEAELSPRYELVEETDELKETAFGRMYSAVVSGRMKGELPNDIQSKWGLTKADITSVEETVKTLQDAGMNLHKPNYLWAKGGIQTLFEEMIGQRDVMPVMPKRLPKEPDLDALKACAREIIKAVRAIKMASYSPVDPNRALGDACRQCLEPFGQALEADSVGVFFGYFTDGMNLVAKPEVFHPKEKGHESHAFRVYQGLTGRWSPRTNPSDSTVEEARKFIDENVAPWLLTMAMRIFPTACAYYDLIKREREAIDQMDLLLQVRHALKESPEAGECWRGLFDHVLVDEFQDTDPVQMEIVLRLTAENPGAEGGWNELVPRAGSLTVVGDPKQSIYRFRRADIATYARVMGRLEELGALSERLVTNFRSTGRLLDSFNSAFGQYLGTASEGERFSANSTQALYEPLKPKPGVKKGKDISLLSFASSDGSVDSCREVEAEEWARTVHALVEDGDAGYGDIAILAASTGCVPLLMKAFDRYGVPYVASGGQLFARDETVRQLVFLLRAIVDNEDGAALAAVLRPPHFALDLVDLLTGRCSGEAVGAGDAVRRERYTQAVDWLAETRREAIKYGMPAVVARLREGSALARSIAVGPGALARIDRLEEMALMCEQHMHAFGAGVLEAAHFFGEWIESPEKVIIPDPQGDAVHILTIHQSKGLQWPVVGLWDCAASTAGSGGGDVFLASRDGQRVFINISFNGRSYAGESDGKNMEICYPEVKGPDAGLIAEEKAHGTAERQRLVYVAATRAERMLIVPVVKVPSKPSGKKPGKKLWETVFVNDYVKLEELPSVRLRKVKEFPRDRKFKVVKKDDAAREKAMKVWREALAGCGREYLRPVGASIFAKTMKGLGGVGEGISGVKDAPFIPSEDENVPVDGGGAGAGEYFDNSRHGAAFGSTVHAVLEARLAGDATKIETLVERCAKAEGLEGLRKEAAGDVERALETLEKEGITGGIGKKLFVEFPVICASDVLGDAAPGALVRGYIDLLVVDGNDALIIDFKTDEPPAGGAERDPGYVARVQCYIDMIKACSPGLNVKGSLLYTANGSIH